MNRWALILLLVLFAGDASSQTKKRDKAPTTDEVLKEADQKAGDGDLDGALQLLRGPSVDPLSGEVSLRLGRLLERKYDLDGAFDSYRIAGTKLSGAPKGEALGRLSLISEMRGASDAAEQAEAAMNADPSGSWPAVALSRVRAKQGKGNEALELAQKATSAGGAGAAAWAVGFAQEQRGDLAAAEAAYRQAAGSEKGDPEVYRVGASVSLARLLRKQGRAQEAEPILKGVLAVAPGAVEAYKESARVKMMLNRASEAMGDASTAAALAENDAEAQRLVKEVTIAKALSYLQTNQTDLAMQDLTALRDQSPNLPEARVGLAKVFIARRQADQALTELQKAVELEPGLAEAQFQLGYVYHVLKSNPAAALGPYEKALAVEPGNVGYRTHLAAALTDQKQFDRAVAELSKVIETPGYSRPDAFIYLGRAHLGAKRYKEAIPPLEKALALAPSSADAEASLGWCYFGLKDAQGFKKHAGKARSLGYKEPTLLDYLRRVEAGEAIK